jgi:putative nucleotidyltransferase with HDIG domain
MEINIISGIVGIFINLLFFNKLESMLLEYKLSKLDINYIYSTIHALVASLYPILFLYEFIDVEHYVWLCIFSISYAIYDILFVYYNKLLNINQTIVHHTILIIATAKLYLGYYNPNLIYLSIFNFFTEITTPTLNLMLYLNSNKLAIKYPNLFRASALITCINFFIFRIVNGIYITYNIYYSPYTAEFQLQSLLTTMNFIWFFKLLKYKDKKYIMNKLEKERLIENIDKVFGLYDKYGAANYIGEELTQVEHATQAALLASESVLCNHPDIILGAFLHDIGHLLLFENKHIDPMGDLGALEHETVGANYLMSLGFPERTCDVVKNHINTKRYLITKYPHYNNELSDASKKTFEYQGGKMTEEELKTFQLDYNFRIHLNIRKFDDLSKDNSPEMLQKIKDMDPINFYKKMAIAILIK